jgi:hypothetical protein
VLPVVILQYKSSGHILANRINSEVEQGYFGCIPYKMVQILITAVKVQRKPADLSNSTYEAQNFVLLATLLHVLCDGEYASKRRGDPGFQSVVISWPSMT